MFDEDDNNEGNNQHKSHAENNTSFIQHENTKSSTQRDSSWPESLKNYVNRAFAACFNIVDKDRIEIILKGKLTLAYNEGTIWAKDWDKEPLPLLCDQLVRSKSPSPTGKRNRRSRSHSRSSSPDYSHSAKKSRR